MSPRLPQKLWLELSHCRLCTPCKSSSVKFLGFSHAVCAKFGGNPVGFSSGQQTYAPNFRKFREHFHKTFLSQKHIFASASFCGSAAITHCTVCSFLIIAGVKQANRRWTSAQWFCFRGQAIRSNRCSKTFARSQDSSRDASTQSLEVLL